MKTLMLQLAWFFSLLGTIVVGFAAVASLFSGNLLASILFLLGIPTLIAHMIVFDYVRTRLDSSTPLAKPDNSAEPNTKPNAASDTLGTPWHKNPGHTL
jgi:predicted transporter